MTIRAWKLTTAVLAMVVLPGVAGAASCWVNEPRWRGEHDYSERLLHETVETLGTTVANEAAITQQQLIGAVKVATRQRSLNATREAEFQQASGKAVAQTYIAQRTAEKIRDAHNTYGPAGQAVGACEAVEMIQRVGAAFGSVQERASEISTGGTIFGAPGDSRSAGQGAGQVLAYDKPEAVSAEAFLDPETPAELRDAFMNNVIGLPLDKPKGRESVSDRVELMQDRRIEAVRSPARLSLAVVRAASDQAGHAEVDGGEDVLSSFEAADLLIAQYGGGPKYEEWSAALVTKSEVGILKEIARLRSIHLMLTNTRQASADRRQVMISALIGAEAVR